MAHIITIFSCLTLIVELKACNPEPVNLLFFNNGASMDGNQKNFSAKLVRNVSVSLQKDSSVYLYELTDYAKEIIIPGISSKESVANEVIRDDIQSVSGTMEISASAINTVLSSKFSVNLYKRTAEFVVLLVSDKTKLDAVSLFLEKKKTFVIVFGSSIPNILKYLASREDYLYQVGSLEDLEVVISKINERIACDSNQYCDADMYSLGKGYKCKSCAQPCSNGNDICTKRCLFMKPKSGTKDDKNETTDVVTAAHADTHDVGTSSKDKKHDAVITIIVAIVAIVAVVVLAVIGIVMVKCCRKWRQSPLTPGSSDETIPKTSLSDSQSFDKAPIEAQQDNEENQPFIGNQVYEAAGSNQDAVINMPPENIPVNFKKGQEWDLNVYADRDQHQAIHA